MAKYFQIQIILILIFSFYNISFSQVKGINEPIGLKDSVFVFKSPRPLLQKNNFDDENTWAWGVDFLLSNNGFGFGTFYQHILIKNWFVFASLYVSGARNTDEFEIPNYQKQEYLIPGKIHRLFMFPLTFGIQKYLFRDILQKNFKPFVNAGVGSALILSTPYPKEFFSAFGDAKVYIRLATFIGAGANIGTINSSLIGINIRYYYIPFGGNGLQSIIHHPIKDFGGLFISLSIGKMF